MRLHAAETADIAGFGKAEGGDGPETDMGRSAAQLQVADELRKWNRVSVDFSPGMLAFLVEEFGGGDYSIFADATQGVIVVATEEWTKVELAHLAYKCPGMDMVRLDVKGMDDPIVPFVAVREEDSGQGA